MGAALAYYSLFSIAPLLLIVVSVAGLLFGEQAARGEILAQLTAVIGEESARTVNALLEDANRPQLGTISAIVGVLALVIGATTVFTALQASMDRIWRVPAPATVSGWVNVLRSRLLSLGMILGLGFLLIVSLTLSAALAALGKWWAPWFAEISLVGQAINTVVSFSMLAVLFAMIFKWMPRAHVTWRDVWIGAGVTAALFMVGKMLIEQYIGRSGLASSYGAAASLMLLLLWVYYSAQIFLLGVEFTWVYARSHGSRREALGQGGAIEPEKSAVVPQELRAGGRT